MLLCSLYRGGLTYLATATHRSTGALILRLAYGYEVAQDQDQAQDRLVRVVEIAMQGFAKASEPGAFLVDNFPLLRCVPEWLLPGGGFKAVGRGQVEAADALGLSPWRVFSLVRLPLALRAMLPILANQYVWLIKATTMGIAIGFTDFFMIVALTINHSGQTIEAIGLLMAGFLVINLTLAAVFNRVNKAIALKGNQLRG